MLKIGGEGVRRGCQLKLCYLECGVCGQQRWSPPLSGHVERLSQEYMETGECGKGSGPAQSLGGGTGEQRRQGEGRGGGDRRETEINLHYIITHTKSDVNPHHHTAGTVHC